ncbi:MAG: peptide deformylase, partial [Verrucomicrobiaceae bacterium]
MSDIIHYPDPRLSQPSEPVTQFDDDLAKLAQRMVATMIEEKGVGLAAVQIGVLKRIIVTNADNNLIVMCNPEITVFSDETKSHGEGCLSIPGIKADVTRPARVLVDYQTLSGEPQSVSATDLLAVVVQH